MAKQLVQMGEMGVWLSVIPNCFDGTELLWEEFNDNLAICYGLCPKGLPKHCDGGREPFTVECVCVLTRPPGEKDHWPLPPIKAGWHSSFSP
jgi:hypothetical protein